MNSYHPDMHRLLARERHEQRLREAELERLARVVRGSGQRRRRLRVTTIRLSPKPRQRPHQPRFNP